MIKCLDNSHFTLIFTMNTMSKLAEEVALHTCTWRYLLWFSAGTQIILMFFKYFLSPSRQMLGQYLVLGHDHFHILSNSLYIIILSFYT